jgi:3-deoxy-7-phosphoheptulonate synthase
MVFPFLCTTKLGPPEESGGLFAFHRIVAFAETELKGCIEMIIVMKKGAGAEALAEVEKRIVDLGYQPHVIHGETRNVVGAVGDERGKEVLQTLEALPGVERVVPILKPYKLASREVQPQTSEIEIVPGLVVGGKEFVVIRIY